MWGEWNGWVGSGVCGRSVWGAEVIIDAGIFFWNERHFRHESEREW